MSEQRPLNGSGVRSLFADDPEMRDLVELFVEELPDRVQSIAASWEQRNLEDLLRVAHQLKGASGGYGFQVVGDAAKRLEESLRAQADVDSIQQDVEELLELCNRVTL